VDALQAAVASAESQVRAASAVVDAIRQLESYLTITAPFDGTVSERNVHPGALVGPQASAETLLRLEHTRRLRLVVSLPEAEVAGIVRGSTVAFNVPAYPSTSFHGTIARVAGSIDPKTRTMPVELDVVNHDGRLAPGMYADVHWTVRSPAATLMVPKTSVVTTTERVFVICVRNGKANWIDVRRGAADKDMVEVIGDLKAGETVVARASDEIRNGAPIVARP
jgi:RND family efflux transporter MFP subunit